jgi:hypothetical protein
MGETKKVAEFFGVRDWEENWTESFNVAPNSTIPVVVADKFVRKSPEFQLAHLKQCCF